MRDRLVTAASSAVATATVGALLRARPPGGAERWQRRNHRGEVVTLLEGPQVVLGAAAGVLVARTTTARSRAAAIAAVLGAGTLGAYDDLAGDSRRKGLSGHLGALARGEVTTGAVKVLGLAATGLLAAVVLEPPSSEAGGPRTGSRSVSTLSSVTDVMVSAMVVAGAANLLNLLDLRPGRALKTTLLASLPALAGGPGAALLAVAGGAAGAALPRDLAERSMLGDTGANATGALLGTALLCGAGRRRRLGLLAGLTALTLASEKVSFTRVIERTPVLRELDGLGRRPPG